MARASVDGVAAAASISLSTPLRDDQRVSNLSARTFSDTEYHDDDEDADES